MYVSSNLGGWCLLDNTLLEDTFPTELIGSSAAVILVTKHSMLLVLQIGTGCSPRESLRAEPDIMAGAPPKTSDFYVSSGVVYVDITLPGSC